MTPTIWWDPGMAGSLEPKTSFSYAFIYSFLYSPNSIITSVHHTYGEMDRSCPLRMCRLVEERDLQNKLRAVWQVLNTVRKTHVCTSQEVSNWINRSGESCPRREICGNWETLSPCSQLEVTDKGQQGYTLSKGLEATKRSKCRDFIWHGQWGGQSTSHGAECRAGPPPSAVSW